MLEDHYEKMNKTLSILVCVFFFLAMIGVISAEESTGSTTEGTQSYKKLSLKELMELEVTSVSRRPEKLSDSASAIQVITQDDIRRSGASRLPEALRLATNLQVYQTDSTNWAISARGFDNSLANKLLVMMDGRTLYTPLFAGVFWDVQDTLLEDIDRIEVISGPGATSWGANAVNGVINITTKTAKETQGLMLLGAVGTELRDLAGVRYGGLISNNAYYRVYGKYYDRDGTKFPNGEDVPNEWRMGQGGFRIDWEKSQSDLVTFQGDIYDGERTHKNDSSASGGNLIGRWSRTNSENSNYNLQLYFDRTHRHTPGSFKDVLNTFDVDFQNRFSFNRHDLVWGLGYRVFDDHFQGTESFAFLPPKLTQQLFSAFVQDEIALLPDELFIVFGTKIEHNDYTGFEIQPSGRVAWKLNEEQTLWGAISRAVRTPSRIDRDFFAPQTPPFLIAGGPNYDSEELIAYELGYRVHPHERLYLSLATFFNDYDKIRTIEQVNPPFIVPVVFENKQEGESYGAELTMDYRLSEKCRLSAGYTEFRVNIRPKPGSTDQTHGAAEARDADRQFYLRSWLDLPAGFEFDATFRAISEIKVDNVPAYGELNLRLGWHPTTKLEFSIVGQNLLHADHFEFNPARTRQAIERGVYLKFLWRL